MSSVKVRFAPSPTGYMHIGNTRTAIFNWLLAQKLGGEFMLRIDDTDKERSKKEYEDAIRESLKWLGLTWSEEARQSARFARYQEVTEKLMQEGRIYACYETAEELDMMRKKSYDLLITDLKMAEVNGIEILEMMRMVNVRNSKTIPVVVMTAAPNVSEQELLDAGFVACLFKPMSDKDLIHTARKCVNGKIAEKQIDFSMLLTYGTEKETLENFVKEMTDTLGSIRNAAKEENRKKMSDAIHHARSSWMMVQSDESLNYLFDLIEDSTSSDDVINQAVEDVFAHGEEIIKAAQKKIEEVTA